MKKRILITVLAICGIYFASIPFTKSKLVENIQPNPVPENFLELDSYLQNSESKFPNLTQGTEKQILWVNKSKKITDRSILFFHGFGASAPELHPLIPMLAKDIEANVFFARLKGHGLTGEEFAQANANDWLNDAVESLLIASKIGKKVIIIGSSTGCLLAMWLASKPEYKDQIDGMVLMSANFHPASALSDIALYPSGLGLMKLIYGKERSWEPKNEIVAKYWLHKYPWEAIVPMMVLVDASSKWEYEKMETPVLFLYSEKDDVIDIKKIIAVHNKYKSPKKKLLNVKESNNHVMAGDAMSPDSTLAVKEIILDYLKNL